MLSMTFLLLGLAQMQIAEASLCTVSNEDTYFALDVEEDFDFQDELDRAVRALYQGPLMRDPDPQGEANLRNLLSTDEEMDIRYIQKIIRDHLYDSPEFREQLQKLTSREGEVGASYRMLESIYRAFGYEPDDASEAVFDACLIRNENAHLVVSKALVSLGDD